MAGEEVAYLRAACVAARAGVTSPGNGRLSPDELVSIPMLISLQQTSSKQIAFENAWYETLVSLR